MVFLDKLKKKLRGSNGEAKDCTDGNCPGHNCECGVLGEIDNTMIDAGKRIEKMLEEIRHEV